MRSSISPHLVQGAVETRASGVTTHTKATWSAFGESIRRFAPSSVVKLGNDAAQTLAQRAL